MNIAATTLQREIETAIEQIEKAQAPKDCAAHRPMALGVVTLLRVESAKMDLDSAFNAGTWDVVRGIFIKVGGGVILAFLGAWLMWLKLRGLGQ